MVRALEVDGVVIADLDRLLRAERLDDIELLQVFQDTGALVYSGGMEYDFASPEGRLSGLMRVAVTGFELSLFKQRVRDAKESQRRAGKCPSSSITLPRGVSYDRQKQIYFYNDRVAGVVEAFRLIDEEGLSNIALVASKVGIEPRTLHNLLRNEIYTGRRVYAEKRGTEKYGAKNGRQSDRRKVTRSDTERIEVDVIDTPAVSRERFERVQRILDAKRTRWNKERDDAETVNLGVGVATCGYCGERLYCSSGRRKNRAARGYYMCKRNYYLYRRETGGCEMRNIFKDDLDETIRKFTAVHLRDKAVLIRLVDHAVRSYGARLGSSRTADIAGAYEADLRRRENRLTDLYEAGHIEMDELVNRKTALRRRRRPAQPGPLPVIDVQRIAQLIIRGALAFARIRGAKQQKAVIDQLFSEIRFRDDMIVSFKLQPQFLEAQTDRRAGDAQSGIRTDMDSWRRRA